VNAAPVRKNELRPSGSVPAVHSGGRTLVGAGPGAPVGAPVNHPDTSTTTSVPPEEYKPTPTVEVGTIAMAAAISRWLGPFTELVPGSGCLAGNAVT
jgi:hypothetical protein